MDLSGQIKVQDILIYPIKSMGGISLNESFARRSGFQYDRKWMLVDEYGLFLSQRTVPEMAKFKTSINDIGIVVKIEDDIITIPFEMADYGIKKARIHDDWVTVCLTDDSFNKWFSERLNKKSYLVFMDDNNPRYVNPKYSEDNDTVDFADAFPYLLLSQASLNNLNQKLDYPVPMNRFRPNIVISGIVPFAEDSMRVISAGNAQFKIVKPCDRCVITTTDQETGERYKEPLKTLSTFRKKDGKVLFGQNLLCLKEGKISIGDQIKIKSVKTSDI